MATTPSEMIAFKASEEPRLIRASKLTITKDTVTALRGMFHPGVTIESQEEPGTPYATSQCMLSGPVSVIMCAYLVAGK